MAREESQVHRRENDPIAVISTARCFSGVNTARHKSCPIDVAAFAINDRSRQDIGADAFNEPLAFRGGVVYQDKDRLPQDAAHNRALANKSAVLELPEQTS
jgi:hypothetical protein